MSRKDASVPNERETFERLKARLGRPPTVDELSWELETAVRAPAPSAGKRDRRSLARGITIVAMVLLSISFYMKPPLYFQQWLSPDATVPTLPPAPVRDVAQSRAVLPAETPSPPAPSVARTEPPVQRAAPLVKDESIQHRVLPEIPASARNTIRGRVRINIRVSVDPSGTVTAADSISPEASRYFTGLAVKAALAWRFAPTPPEGGGTTREWVLRFELGQQDTSVAAVRTLP